MQLEMWHLAVAVAALLGPALVFAGRWLGVLQERSKTQHDRSQEIDTESKKRDQDVERRLTAEFERLGDRLEDAIKQGWMHCPKATKDPDRA